MKTPSERVEEMKKMMDAIRKKAYAMTEIECLHASDLAKKLIIN